MYHILCRNRFGDETGYDEFSDLGLLMCEVKCPCGQTFTNTHRFKAHLECALYAAEYFGLGITPCTHYVRKCCPMCDKRDGPPYECVDEAGVANDLLEKHLKSAHTCTVCNASVRSKFECLKAHFVDAAFTPYNGGCGALMSALETASSGGDDELAYVEAAGLLLASPRCPKALANKPQCDVAEALASAASEGLRPHSVSQSMVTAAAEVLNVFKNVLPKFKTCGVCGCPVHDKYAEAHMRGHRTAAGRGARTVVFQTLYIYEDCLDNYEWCMASYETALQHSHDQLLQWFRKWHKGYGTRTRGTSADEFARMCRNFELTEADQVWAIDVVKRRWFSPRGRGFDMAMGRFSKAASACGIGS